MRDVLPTVVAELARGEPVAMATVMRTWHSAPRPPGSAMVVTSGGDVAGAVSGGCVEGDVYERAREVLRTGVPERVRYGVADEDAFAVGLVCGGTIEVVVTRVGVPEAPAFSALAADLDAGRRVALATVVEGAGAGRHIVVRPGDAVGTSGDGRLDGHVVADARQLLGGDRAAVLRYGPDAGVRGDAEVLVATYAPPPRLIVCGAADYGAALCRVARGLGFRVSVVDARGVFATAARFPDADEVVVDRPDRWLSSQDLDARAAVCVLTHDPKFDVPTLVAALRTPAGYVGALGSRRTHADRVVRLREAGLDDHEIGRIRAPIGLDLGAVTAEETAVSIAAEVIAVLRGGSGRSLTGRTGPIHGGAA